MKRNYSYLLLLISIMSLFSCNSEKETFKNDLLDSHALEDQNSFTCGAEEVPVSKSSLSQSPNVFSSSAAIDFKMATVFIQYNDLDPLANFTFEQAREKMISLKDYYFQASYEKINLIIDNNLDGQPDVYLVRIDENQPTSTDIFLNHSKTKYHQAFQTQHGFSMENYSIVNYVVPTLIKTTYSGIAQCNPTLNSDVSSKCYNVFHNSLDTERLWIHEVGHDFGFEHSRHDFEKNSFHEYGDPTCPMGRSWLRNSPNPFKLAQFLPPSKISQLRIYPDLNNPYAPQKWDVRLAATSAGKNDTYPISTNVLFLSHLSDESGWRQKYGNDCSNSRCVSYSLHYSSFISHRKKIGLDQVIPTDWTQGLFFYTFYPEKISTKALNYTFKYTKQLDDWYVPNSFIKVLDMPVKYEVRVLSIHPDQSVTVRIERVLPDREFEKDVPPRVSPITTPTPMPEPVLQ